MLTFRMGLFFFLSKYYTSVFCFLVFFDITLRPDKVNRFYIDF